MAAFLHAGTTAQLYTYYLVFTDIIPGGIDYFKKIYKSRVPAFFTVILDGYISSYTGRRNFRRNLVLLSTERGNWPTAYFVSLLDILRPGVYSFSHNSLGVVCQDQKKKQRWPNSKCKKFINDDLVNGSGMGYKLAPARMECLIYPMCEDSRYHGASYMPPSFWPYVQP